MNSIARTYLALPIFTAVLLVAPIVSVQGAVGSAVSVDRDTASAGSHIAYLDRLRDYARDHPIEGATARPSLSSDGKSGKIESGEVAYFSHGAMIYRVTFDGQGKRITEGKTPDGRAFDTMKRFAFGYDFGGEHGITAAMLGEGSDGNSHIQRVSFTGSDGQWRGFMRFDGDGMLTSGVVFGQDGNVKARWEGRHDSPSPAPSGGTRVVRGDGAIVTARSRTAGARPSPGWSRSWCSPERPAARTRSTCCPAVT